MEELSLVEPVSEARPVEELGDSSLTVDSSPKVVLSEFGCDSRLSSSWSRPKCALDRWRSTAVVVVPYWYDWARGSGMAAPWRRVGLWTTRRGLVEELVLKMDVGVLLLLLLKLLVGLWTALCVGLLVDCCSTWWWVGLVMTMFRLGLLAACFL